MVSEQTLKDLVKELKHTGTLYRQKVHTIITASYKTHYRRMVPEILRILEFRSGNAIHYPVLRSLLLLKKYSDAGSRYYSENEDVPIDGVIRPSMEEFVIEKDSRGNSRVSRIKYEVCVLQALREKLRCKEIWVVGANRYRNPEEDLPTEWGKRYTDRGIRKILAKYTKLAGLTHSLSPHKLRHFLFTWLKKQGIDDALIQPYSGHESRQSLGVYSKLAITEAQEKYNQVINKFPV